MKHPSQETLALHAGGDLGLFARWRTARHLSKCDACREEASRYEAVREITGDLVEIPEVPWNRLAAEMKANIRLGLAAGECVRASEPLLHATPIFTRTRAAVAMASIVALAVTGLMLEKPAPVLADEGVVVQATTNGIQIRKGRHAFRLMNNVSDNAQQPVRVTYSSDAQGAVGARQVDPETNYITINRVYVE
jgi:hypothetical protein